MLKIICSFDSVTFILQEINKTSSRIVISENYCILNWIQGQWVRPNPYEQVGETVEQARGSLFLSLVFFLAHIHHNLSSCYPHSFSFP